MRIDKAAARLVHLFAVITVCLALPRPLGADQASWASARQDDAKCAVIGAWVARYGREFPGPPPASEAQIQSGLANLFSDPDFVPHFGRPFASLDRGARREIARFVSRCVSGPPLGVRVATALSVMLRDEDEAFRTRAILEARVKAWARVDAARAAIGALPVDPASFGDALTLAQELRAALTGMWPSHIDEAVRSLSASIAPIADVALGAWVDQVEADVRGAAMARAARNRLMESRADEGLRTILEHASAAGVERAGARLQDLEAAQIGHELEALRQGLDSLGHGLEALQAGIRWHREFTAQVSAYQNHSGIQPLLADFRARRHGHIQASARTLVSRIAAATTGADVREVITDYLGLDEDQRDTAAQPVLRAAAGRLEALAAAAEQAEREARSAGAICRTLSSSSPRGRAEPSAREMCETLAATIDAVNEDFASTANRCRAGRLEDNPMLAVKCLGLCGATFGSCTLSVKLVRFRKIACGEPLRAEPGIYCDYGLELSFSHPMLASMAAELGGFGDIVQARFVRTERGWIRLR